MGDGVPQHVHDGLGDDLFVHRGHLGASVELVHCHKEKRRKAESEVDPRDMGQRRGKTRFGPRPGHGLADAQSGDHDASVCVVSLV